jgi:hypothetical protein
VAVPVLLSNYSHFTSLNTFPTPSYYFSFRCGNIYLKFFVGFLPFVSFEMLLLFLDHMYYITTCIPQLLTQCALNGAAAAGL